MSYASILAFFLRESGYSAGRADLPGDLAPLRGIEIGSPVDEQ